MAGTAPAAAFRRALSAVSFARLRSASRKALLASALALGSLPSAALSSAVPIFHRGASPLQTLGVLMPRLLRMLFRPESPSLRRWFQAARSQLFGLTRNLRPPVGQPPRAR